LTRRSRLRLGRKWRDPLRSLPVPQGLYAPIAPQAGYRPLSVPCVPYRGSSHRMGAVMLRKIARTIRRLWAAYRREVKRPSTEEERQFYGEADKRR
jgi:hypothetical protein